MLLTDDEINACWNGPMPSGFAKSQYDIARAIESAILAKLAGAELPEPVAVYANHRATPEGTTEFYGFASNHLSIASFLYTAEQLHQAFAQGAAAQLAEKPSAWSYKQNRVHRCLATHCPPDDAYDAGTLIELYTRREAK